MFHGVINLNISDEDAGKIVIEAMLKAFKASNPVAWKDWDVARMLTWMKNTYPMTPVLLGRIAKREKIDLDRLNDVVLRAWSKEGLVTNQANTYANAFEKAAKYLGDMPIIVPTFKIAWMKYVPYVAAVGAAYFLAQAVKPMRRA